MAYVLTFKRAVWPLTAMKNKAFITFTLSDEQQKQLYLNFVPNVGDEISFKELIKDEIVVSPVFVVHAVHRQIAFLSDNELSESFTVRLGHR